jgi:hypothetical protein
MPAARFRVGTYTDSWHPVTSPQLFRVLRPATTHTYDTAWLPLRPSQPSPQASPRSACSEGDASVGRSMDAQPLYTEATVTPGRLRPRSAQGTRSSSTSSTVSQVLKTSNRVVARSSSRTASRLAVRRDSGASGASACSAATTRSGGGASGISDASSR